MKNPLSIVLIGLLTLLFSGTLVSAPVNKASLSPRIAALPAAATPESCNLDFDGNGSEDALTDGILFMRYLSGYADGALVDGALGTGATRTTGAAITAFLDQSDCTAMKDIDGNGMVDAQTDGLLLMRYLFGFSGQALVQDALAVDAKRTGGNDILNLLAFYRNPRYAIISGTVAEGGRISDTWEDLIVEGAGPGSSTVRLVEGKNFSGEVVFELTTTGGDVRLSVQDANLMALQDATATGNSANAKAISSSAEGYPLTKEWSSGFGWFSGKGELFPDLIFLDRSENRLPMGTKVSLVTQFVHGLHRKKSYALMSACTKTDANCYKNAKDPVLLVHGFLVGESMGGGEGTWASFPALLIENAYVPFEFRWNTSARFHDVAVELGGAIKQIADKTGKKVHIIAHSFGGLLTRALLQQLATYGNEDFGKYVASVTTLGSPHSGIMDSNGCAFDRALPNGQDSVLFKGCGQISCQQAGERIFGEDASEYFGIHDKPGSIPVSLANSLSSLPDVDIQVLIGLATQETIIPGVGSIYRSLKEGDGLITGWGQRFNPENATSGDCSQGNIDLMWNSLLNSESMGKARVTEHVLGFGQSVKPGDQSPNSSEPGYKHSASKTVLPLHSTPEPYVECTTSASCTHDGYEKSLAWIKLHPSTPVSEDNHITLMLRALRGDVAGGTLSGVRVLVYVNAQSVVNEVAMGYTDADGTLSLQVPFISSNTYGVLMMPPAPYRGAKDYFESAVNYEDSKTSDLGDITFVDSNDPSPILNDGLIVNESGTPLAGVSVTLRRIDHSELDQSFQSQSSGVFSFTALAGRYELKFSKPGYKGVTHKINSPISNLTITLQAGANLTGELVAHYAFEGSAMDSSGNRHHGRAENGVEYVAGAVGRAASFDGVNDYIRIPHDDALNVQPNANLTLAMWINRSLPSADNEQHVLSKGHDCANSYYIREGGQEIGAAQGSSWCDGTQINVSFPENEWHHVAAVIDNNAGKIRYYLDGVLKTEQTISAYTTTNTYPLIIGRHFVNADGSGGYEYPFKGMVDDLYIYNRVLSLGEIQALHQKYEPLLPPGSGIFTLNDTGITWGGDYPSGNNTTCTSNINAPQDCHQGRDATHNDDSDGHAGFSFTKLDANGNPLSPSANSWSCVTDNVTGLMWEVKTTDGGLHDRDDRYNWYNTDPTTNGGFEGYADDDGNICYGYDVNDPASYCNTQAFVARVNQAGWCGYNDWRMPNREELRSLVDYSIASPGPTIDTRYFPNDPGSDVWSSSPNADSSNGAWVLYFDYGYDYRSNKDYSYHVRLVRGGQ